MGAGLMESLAGRTLSPDLLWCKRCSYGPAWVRALAGNVIECREIEMALSWS